jgi:hypothetical protein
VVDGRYRQPQTYVKPEAAITVFELLMMSGVSHVEQLRSIGIINSTTWSHLVGYFYTIYTLPLEPWFSSF